MYTLFCLSLEPTVGLHFVRRAHRFRNIAAPNRPITNVVLLSCVLRTVHQGRCTPWEGVRSANSEWGELWRATQSLGWCTWQGSLSERYGHDSFLPSVATIVADWSVTADVECVGGLVCWLDMRFPSCVHVKHAVRVRSYKISVGDWLQPLLIRRLPSYQAKLGP